jgi:hypothetical protein
LLRCLRRKASESCGKPCLRSDGNFGATLVNRIEEFIGGVGHACGHERCTRGKLEPGFLFSDLAAKLSMNVSAGAHEARTNGRDADTPITKLGMQKSSEKPVRANFAAT